MFGFDVFYHKLNQEMTLDVTHKDHFESFSLREVISRSSHSKDNVKLLEMLEEYCSELRSEMEEEAYLDCL